MITLRRKAFASSIALAFFLLVTQFNFRPFTADSLRSIVNASHYAEELFRNQPDSFMATLRYVIRRLFAPSFMFTWVIMKYQAWNWAWTYRHRDTSGHHFGNISGNRPRQDSRSSEIKTGRHELGRRKLPRVSFEATLSFLQRLLTNRAAEAGRLPFTLSMIQMRHFAQAWTKVVKQTPTLLIL